MDGLQDAGYPVKLVNTSAVRQYEGLKFSDDRHDAIRLAHLDRLGILPTGFIMPRERRGIRDLVRKRMRLVQMRTACITSNQGIQSRVLGARMNVREIKKMDRDSISENISDPFVAMSLGSTQAIIIALSREIDQIERAVLGQIRRTPEWKRLTSIWGIGEVLASIIQLETGPIERFLGAGEYASYCRCVPTRYTSNDRKKGEGNAKNGNRYLAWAFIEAAARPARLSARPPLVREENPQGQPDPRAKSSRTQDQPERLLRDEGRGAVPSRAAVRIMSLAGTRNHEWGWVKVPRA